MAFERRNTYQFRSLYHRTVAEKEEEFVINAFRPDQESILEIGPGSGRMTRHLCQLADALTVCDVDSETIFNLKERFRAQGQFDFRVLPFESIEQLPGYGRFSAAVAVRVVPHVADWRGALQRLVRSVRPGGLAIFDLWNRQSFVGLLMKAFPRAEPVVVHRLSRRDIKEALAGLPAQPIAALRWGYPRVGPFHLDDLGASLFPSFAYSTMFCVRRIDA